MGMAATNVKADTVSGSQTTDMAAKQATDSVKNANDPAPVNDVKNGADQKSATSEASKTQTVQVNDLKTTVPSGSLRESKAVSTEPEAQNVDTNLDWNGGKKLADQTNWTSSQWSSFGYDGKFDIALKDLVAGNNIIIGNYNATSSNEKYMFFTGDGGNHWISYTDPKTHEVIPEIGKMYVTGNGQHGQVILNINKSIYNAQRDKDKADKLIHFDFVIKDFVIVNYLTDQHIYKGATKQNPYTETMEFTGKKYQFNIVPQLYDVKKNRNLEGFTPYGQTDTGALQNYAHDYAIRDDQTFQDLQSSQGQKGNVYIPDTYKFYYKVTVKDPSDLANYGFHSPRVDYFTNSSAINSDGKMTDEGHQMNGANVPLSQAADNQSFDELDATVGKDGASWSKQADGSYLFVVHISPDTIRRHVYVPDGLKNTNTVVFDQDEGKANQAAYHFYQEGAMKGLPTCIVPEIRIYYNNYSTTAPQYTLHTMKKQGNKYVEDDRASGSMSPVVDTSDTKGQAGITVHYLNGQTGEAMDGYTTVTTTFGEPGASSKIEIPNFAGFHLRKSKTTGDITFDNNSKQSVKAGDIVVNSEDGVIKLPAADTISNVYLVFDGDNRTDTVEYYDEDDNNKLLFSDSVQGKVGQIKSYSTADAIKKNVKNYTVDKDELTTENANQGINGIKFDASGNHTYKVYLKHATQDNSATVSVSQIINYNYQNGNKAADSNTQILQFTHHVTKDLVTGKNTVDHWDGEKSFNSVTSPTIAGYTPSEKTIEAKPVKHDDVSSSIDIVYTPNTQTGSVTYIDDDDHGKILANDELSGASDSKSDYKVRDYSDQGYKVNSSNVPDIIVFDHNESASQDYEVHLVHQHITVTPNQPQDNGNKLPDNPNKTFRGVTATDLNQTIKRTINVAATPESESSQTVQNAHVSRTADVDEVTGHVTYNPWTTDTWQEFDTPAVPGYTPDQSKVTAQTVTHDAKDIKIDIVYSPDKQKALISYIDDVTGETLTTVPYTGVTDQVIDTKANDKVSEYEKSGYKLADHAVVPAQITFDNDEKNDQAYEVHLTHAHTTVQPTDPKTPDDIIPGTDHHYPAGVSHDDLNRTVTRTITVNYPDGHKKTAVQKVTFTQTADVDEVTGEVTKYSGWVGEGTNQDQGTFGKYDIPTVKGYTPHEKSANTNTKELVLIEVPSDNDLEKETDGHYEVKSMTVNHGSDDIKIDIAYSPDPQSATLNFVDDDAKTSLANWDQAQGKSDGPIEFTHASQLMDDYAKQGYKFAYVTNDSAHVTLDGDDLSAALKNLGNYDTDDAAEQIFTVHLTHAHTTVQPTDPKTPDDIIPGTDHHYPAGVSHDDLNRTVTRTINISGNPRKEDHSTTTPVTLHRTADVDEVTGKVTYGDWSKGHFDQTSMDLVPGYTYHISKHTDDGIDPQADLADIPAEDVTVNTPNEIFDVRYTPDDQSAYLNFVDDDSNTELANWDQAQGKSDRGPISFAHATQIMDDYAKQGYQFVDVTNDSGKVTLAGQTLSEALKNLGNYDHIDDTDQIFTVHLTHGHTTVQPTDPKTPDDTIPGTDHHYPAGVSHDDLNRTVTRTITVNYPDGRKETIVQKATFTRTADVDDVTGKVTYGKWNRDAQQLAEFTAPSVPGYLPDIAVVEAVTVTPDSDDLTVEINYHVDPAVEAARQARLAQSNAISTANQGHANGQRNEAHQLPQTGNNHDGALIGLGIAGAMSMLGLAKTKRRHS